jgi:hypothetical protein
MVILSRKIMGMGTKRLLEYQSWLKRKQSAAVTSGHTNLGDRNRESPMEEGELLEVLEDG